MTTQSQILAALHKLGGDADEIAESLAERGISGKTCDDADCALARYLAAAFPGTRVTVGAAEANVGGCLTPLPEECREFVERFGQEDWPELVSERDE